MVHKNPVAPVAVSVVELPAQITDDAALTDTTGAALTVTVRLDVDEHPLAFVPVTEYEVVVPGLTAMLAEVAPLLHR